MEFFDNCENHKGEAVTFIHQQNKMNFQISPQKSPKVRSVLWQTKVSTKP